MPCYHFTWHAYASWLPDRPRGYVHWNRGLQPSSPGLAACYRKEQREATVAFTSLIQQAAIEESQIAAKHQRFRLHAVGTDNSHIHLLASWHDERCWGRLAVGIRSSLSRRLNTLERRTWFSRGRSRKRVRDQAHFDYLIGEYLPSHLGWKWDERRGLFLKKSE